MVQALLFLKVVTLEMATPENKYIISMLSSIRKKNTHKCAEIRLTRGS